MSTLQIHCPHCAAALAVPDTAGGRKGRCPQCRNTFRVPDPQSMLEDSVTCWLEEAERKEAEHDDLFEAPPDGNTSSKSPDNGKPDPARKPKTDRPKADAIAKTRSSDPAPKAKPPSSSSGSGHSGRKDKPRRVSLGTEGHYEVRSALRAGVKPEEDPEEARYREAPKPPPPKKPKPEPEHAGAGSGDRVVLSVAGVSAAGVKFTFGSNLMNRGAFRASMPMACMLCGTTEPGTLVARPLGWLDKATGKKADPGTIETVYEVEVKQHQTAREVTNSIRTIDELNPPFNQPMPYYICRECAPKVTYVHAEAMSVPDGVICEVHIPATDYALRWLGRVNGVCGDAYEQLETQVVAFTDERWREIDEKVRQRISAWFDFQPNEQYLGYISDSDFAKKDAGLAGIVVTDSRLVYCKYHHHGTVDLLDETNTLVASADGPFHNLTCEHDGTRRKLVRLRQADTDQLIELLRQVEAPVGFEMR